MPPPPDLELELSLPSKSDRKSSKSDRKSGEIEKPATGEASSSVLRNGQRESQGMGIASLVVLGIQNRVLSCGGVGRTTCTIHYK
jgi:hypothetical protein